MLLVPRDVPIFPSPFGSYTNEKIYGTICVSPEDKILLVLGRKSMLWSLPKGHRRCNESSFQCALRELWEETGITIETKELNFSDLPFKRLKVGRYYLLEFEQEVRPCPQDPKEIVTADWFSPDEIQALIDKKQTNIDVRKLGDLLETLTPNKIDHRDLCHSDQSPSVLQCQISI
jgi:8-oxo-dGTP pyrophosphatase MutT (NUDIX family)